MPGSHTLYTVPFNHVKGSFELTLECKYDIPLLCDQMHSSRNIGFVQKPQALFNLFLPLPSRLPESALWAFTSRFHQLHPRQTNVSATQHMNPCGPNPIFYLAQRTKRRDDILPFALLNYVMFKI